MPGNNILGRCVIVIDEISPGLYRPDFTQRNMHPAKAATVLADLSKKLFDLVKDDQARREIVYKDKEISDIVSGKFQVPPFETRDPQTDEGEIL